MAKSSGNLIGCWTFLVGVILAVVFGLMGELSSTMAVVLVIIGLVIGLLNIADAEANHFLTSGAVLIIASSLGAEALGKISYVDGTLNALLTVFTPATIIVAIKNVFKLAKH